jgi:hypothetical protein
MFSDGYANAVVSPVKTILIRLYPGTIDTNTGAVLSALGFAGSEWFSLSLLLFLFFLVSSLFSPRLMCNTGHVQFSSPIRHT